MFFSKGRESGADELFWFFFLLILIRVQSTINLVQTFILLLPFGFVKSEANDLGNTNSTIVIISICTLYAW